MDSLNKYLQSKEYAAIEYRSLLENIRGVFTFAEIRCLSHAELLSRIPVIWKDPNREEVIQCFQEVTLSIDELQILFGHLKYLSNVGETLVSQEKARVDRIIGRLGRLLPGNLAAELVTSLLHSKRKSRREVAYRLIRTIKPSKPLAKLLLQRFREIRDQRLLQIIARSAELVPDLNAEFLLQNLEEHYWRARVIEALIRHDVERAIDLAVSYPREFVHAVGRCGAASLAGVMHNLYEKCQDDLEFVSLYVWALGKIGDRHELERMRSIVDEKLIK
jgi:hypothetical protein